MSVRNPLCLYTLILFLSSSRLVGAQPDDATVDDVTERSEDANSSFELVEEGMELYHEQHYAEAIERFESAYLINRDVNLLFNMARCLEALGKRDEAIAKYEAYVGSDQAQPEGIERARRALEKLEKRRTPAPPATSSEAESDPQNDGSTDRSPETHTVSARPQPESTSWLPYWLLGGGVLVGAAGATFYVLGMNDHRDVTDARGYSNRNAPYELTRSEAQSSVDSGDRNKTIGVVLASVGGALALTSVTLLVLSPAPNKSTMDTALTLTPREGGAALHLSGAF